MVSNSVRDLLIQIGVDMLILIDWWVYNGIPKKAFKRNKLPRGAFRWSLSTIRRQEWNHLEFLMQIIRLLISNGQIRAAFKRGFEVKPSNNTKASQAKSGKWGEGVYLVTGKTDVPSMIRPHLCHTRIIWACQKKLQQELVTFLNLHRHAFQWAPQWHNCRAWSVCSDPNMDYNRWVCSLICSFTYIKMILPSVKWRMFSEMFFWIFWRRDRSRSDRGFLLSSEGILGKFGTGNCFIFIENCFNHFHFENPNLPQQ